MFVYCLNNPVNMADASGQNPGIILYIVEIVAIVVCAVFTISIIASPQFQRDLADICTYAGQQISAGLETIADSAAKIFTEAVSDGLSSIAGAFDNLECKEAADSMVDYLKKHNKHGSIITIMYTGHRGFVWSDIKHDTISLSGVHVGVEYNGIVYCNVHPYGLPEAQWINDFYGTGERIITKVPF